MRSINFRGIDWNLIIPVVLVLLIGLAVNYPVGDLTLNTLFIKQVIFVTMSLVIIFTGSFLNPTLLRGPLVSFVLYGFAILMLVLLLLFAPEINGAKSWFTFGAFAIQPVDFVKLALIVTLARYFANRHIYIKHVRHVFISIILTGIPFLLVFQQPDLGSSVTLIAIWTGMIFVSGVSKKHIVIILFAAILTSAIGWQFLPSYQQERVLSFLNPLSNLESSGYNAYQSKIAIGSGMVIGKGIGQGTQSKLGFLPLYQSDFVFAAYAEEWGFVGVLLLIALYTVILWRILQHAIQGRTNFEVLFTAGVASLIFSHIMIHIGVNAGIFPVTGITLPFVSYGGSHLIAEAIAIAIVLSMAKNKNMAATHV